MSALHFIDRPRVVFDCGDQNGSCVMRVQSFVSDILDASAVGGLDFIIDISNILQQ